jgi:23S rRNA pseudouridine1911/1915/1917 synthase
MATIKVDQSNVGERLDEALVKANVAPSRAKVQSLIKDHKVLVNDREEKAHYELRLSDVITYQEYTNKQPTLVGEDIPLDVIYEDEDILVINKPAGLVVHPGNGHYDGTLVNALIYHEKELANADDEVRPGLVHRIDKDTSGLLCIAKNDKAFASLSAQLADHSMHREYYALVKGTIYEDDGKIDAPIGRDPIHPTKFAVDATHGREAVTYFHVEKRYQEPYTFISCRLLTGRTHQIRVHLDYIGHPVIGDPLYGEGNRKLYDKGQLLHAYQLTFTHPSTGKLVTFKAPLPDYFQKILDSLN